MSRTLSGIIAAELADVLTNVLNTSLGQTLVHASPSSCSPRNALSPASLTPVLIKDFQHLYMHHIKRPPPQTLPAPTSSSSLWTTQLWWVSSATETRQALGGGGAIYERGQDKGECCGLQQIASRLLSASTEHPQNPPRVLGVHITEDLSWTSSTSSLAQKAQQRLYFLWKGGKARAPAPAPAAAPPQLQPPPHHVLVPQRNHREHPDQMELGLGLGLHVYVSLVFFCEVFTVAPWGLDKHGFSPLHVFHILQFSMFASTNLSLQMTNAQESPW